MAEDRLFLEVGKDVGIPRYNVATFLDGYLFSSPNGFLITFHYRPDLYNMGLQNGDVLTLATRKIQAVADECLTGHTVELGGKVYAVSRDGEGKIACVDGEKLAKQFLSLLGGFRERTKIIAPGLGDSLAHNMYIATRLFDVVINYIEFSPMLKRLNKAASVLIEQEKSPTEWYAYGLLSASGKYYESVCLTCERDDYVLFGIAVGAMMYHGCEYKKTEQNTMTFFGGGESNE